MKYNITIMIFTQKIKKAELILNDIPIKKASPYFRAGLLKEQ